MNESQSTTQKHRRYQVSLRALLLLAIPVAILACFLRAWLPWLNSGPENARPSAFFTPLDTNQLESMFRQLVPKGAIFGSTGARGWGKNISPQRGRWMREWDGSLVCDQVAADRAMRTFRSELQKRVRQHAGEIRDEEQRLVGSALGGFRFVYVEGEYTGTVEATYGPEKPFGAFPESDPPFRMLHIRIEETIGFERDVGNNLGEGNCTPH